LDELSGLVRDEADTPRRVDVLPVSVEGASLDTLVRKNALALIVLPIDLARTNHNPGGKDKTFTQECDWLAIAALVNETKRGANPLP